jgi:hypothetical protein
MDRFIVLQFVLILFAVPLQLFIVTKWSYKNIEPAKTSNEYIFHLTL